MRSLTNNPGKFQAILTRHEAAETIRQSQQGYGKPIISGESNGHRIVAVGKDVYFSPKWKTFPDFLLDYIKRTLGSDWGNAELTKPFNERHPILQWYDVICRYQQETIKKPGEVSSATITGAVACYLGLAYNLYLIKHNVELQERLVRRLKNRSQFQGAYYELIVANVLIRSGFELVLEDETDGSARHCEFAAVSKKTGKRYWIEAKMRAVKDLLGKTADDGTANPNPASELGKHLNGALAKPASDDRLIFIDLNTPPDDPSAGPPSWMEAAVKRLEIYEAKELAAGTTAYVFITNVAHHRCLHSAPSATALPFGLGISDFSKPGYVRLVDAYRQKKRHADLHDIGQAFSTYPQLPSTFDGKMPSEAFGQNLGRIIIGEMYHFGDDDGGFMGTVTTAAVNEAEGCMYLGITDTNDVSSIHRRPMSADELADYRAAPDAYFGMIVSTSRPVQGPLDALEWFMGTYKGVAREELLRRLTGHPEFEVIKSLPEDEILAYYCEGMVAAMKQAGLNHTNPEHLGVADNR
ncbi:hypothetical protein [Acidiphilium iwatense]|uniref:Uncharacterized protein n=1 Tax=Acidiphilium iwatense TaxID=768198 RepID=A0ABS9DX80_9PROT|nr:hypothetical protein [Acidiphilium iwatense]MCF3947347.1 hypothetical protein [Acidiphilium iwatense]